MKLASLHNESELICLIAEGDEKAFREIFEHYCNKLYNYVLKITYSEELAEEIMMDAFCKIWIKREELSGIGRFDSFLYTIVRNQAFNAMKRKAHESSIIKELCLRSAAYCDATEHTVTYNDYQQLLDKAINQLPPQQKLVYNLSRDEGLKYDEIALHLKLSKNTVKAHMKKAMSTLRTAFTNYIVLILGGFLLYY